MRQVIHALIDDLDGGEAAETVHFAIDGVGYEIDLTSENAERMRASFAPFVSAGRRVSGRRSRRARSASAVPAGTSRAGARTTASVSAMSAREVTGADSHTVRAWARQNGFSVTDRGRIPARVLQAYQQAN